MTVLTVYGFKTCSFKNS